jgi:hypothetical protein
VPFGFGKHDDKAPVAEATDPSTQPDPESVPAPAAPDGGVSFDGLTEEWRLVGIMEVSGRLSDALNRRDAISIRDVSWAPIDGSEPFSPVPGLRSIDPYDLIVVLAGEGTLPDQSDDEKAAHRVHKLAYGVVLEIPPYRVRGTVHLFPGSEPERLLDRSNEMFFPVTDGVVLAGETRIGDPSATTILVNRQYLRRVEQAENDRPGDSAGTA